MAVVVVLLKWMKEHQAELKIGIDKKGRLRHLRCKWFLPDSREYSNHYFPWFAANRARALFDQIFLTGTYGWLSFSRRISEDREISRGRSQRFSGS